MEDKYLGDGVYASTDGFHIILDLRAQDSTTRIALEPAVMAALRKYEAELIQAIEARHKAQLAEQERETTEDASPA